MGSDIYIAHREHDREHFNDAMRAIAWALKILKSEDSKSKAVTVLEKAIKDLEFRW